MEDKKTIKCSYALLVIILFATVCFLTDYIVVDRKLREDKTIIYGDVTDKVDSVVDDSNVTDSVDTDNNTVASADYIRDTELTTGCWDEITIKLDNGSIVISDGESTVRYNNVDAKYIHVTGFMECGSITLFYLTNDGNLYEISRLYDLFGDNAKFVSPIKKADNVSEMIDDVTQVDVYGDTGFSNKGIKVLTKNNENIVVYWNSFMPPMETASTMFSRN